MDDTDAYFKRLKAMTEPDPQPFDKSRFLDREHAEADDTIDLHEHDDPGPRYKRILLRLVERAMRKEER